MQKYLITGTAGFIGFHLAERLLKKGIEIVGFDNVNEYYDVTLKNDRLNILNKYKSFTFIKGDLADKEAVFNLFEKHKPTVVVNLAAQAGVRYSIDHPDTYISSNITGFFHILEACRHYPVGHLLYASSSSVYGSNEELPFRTSDQVDHPISLYAATKKSNELMAHTYSHLYKIPTTGLRFFTVYGPMGRPDMAAFIFTEKIIRGEAIQINNHGDMYRDFTYVDDIVTGIVNMLSKPPKANEKGVQYKIYNIGNNKPEHLLKFIEILENCLGKKAIREFRPMQPGDVKKTYADVDDLIDDFAFKPGTSIEDGLSRFVNWYRSYYQV